jgi:hypothetical protein
VIGVQVTEQDGVDLADAREPLQHAKGTMTHIDDETEAVRL